jgi:molybdenum cofactor guanylyltransferase
LTRSAVAAVILAGGAARRMGGAVKPLLEVGGETLLDRQLRALAAADILEVAVSVGATTAPALVDAARARGLPLVVDRVADQGPLGGLLAGLAWSPHPALVCLAGDLPAVAPPLLALIAGRLAAVDAVVPRPAGGAEPLCAGYGVRCAPVIEARLTAGLRRARELAAALEQTGLRVTYLDDAELRAADPDLRSFANWNRPADLG